ncbi:MAG: glycosyltransferase family 39 protein, partial [Bacteroidota bacterium]
MSSVFYIVLLTLSTFTAVIEKISKISPWWWLLAWWGLNMVTAAFSPIDADEAYYWMYAQQLDWGYFDHPPAVALLINLGMHWLPGELGLRLGHVLIGGLTMLIIWDILDRPQGKQAWVAALLLAALPMLQVYGFIATPD